MFIMHELEGTCSWLLLHYTTPYRWRYYTADEFVLSFADWLSRMREADQQEHRDRVLVGHDQHKRRLLLSLDRVARGHPGEIIAALLGVRLREHLAHRSEPVDGPADGGGELHGCDILT